MFHDPCFLIEFGGGNLLALLLFDNATEYITLCNCAWKGLFVHTFCADTCDEGITTWVFSADPSSGGFLSKEKGGAGGGRSPRPTWIHGAVPFKDGVCISVIYEYLMVQVNSSHLKKKVSEKYAFSLATVWVPPYIDQLLKDKDKSSEKHFGSSFLANFLPHDIYCLLKGESMRCFYNYSLVNNYVPC